MWNARIQWPRASRFIFNTYRGWATLVMKGSQEHLYSREGVTQGDPISMFMYTIGTLPLIQLLKNINKWSQVWYADDSSVSGELSSLQEWLTMLMERGPDFGYFPEPSKSYLIVNESNKDLANLLFADFGLKIVTSGRFLGGVVGDKAGRESFVKKKVQD